MISLRETFSRNATGALDRLLDWPEFATYLRERYLKNAEENARREKSAQRQRFYQCRGDAEMFDMLQQVYKSDEVIELRRQFVEFAKYNNISRRITNEVATVYALPAKRTVAGDENNRRYQEVQRLCRQHEVMQRVNRMAFLHRAVAVGPRMRLMPNGQWQPVIDVVTPAKFYAVRDPLDPTLLVALIFETDFALPNSVYRGPSWNVVGWSETMMLTSDGTIVEETVKPHGFTRIPWVLMTLEPPDGVLLDATTGDDITAAQKMIWFLNILHAKESKSTTVQTIVQGDVSSAARRQVNDSDATGQLPEGTSIQTVNRAVDVSIFTDGAQRAGEVTGSNYGIAPHVMRGDSVASAAARDLDRGPLYELRAQQQIPFREFEREFAEVQSEVVSQKRADLAFTTADGWGVNFADSRTPLSEKEALEVFTAKRTAGLTSTPVYMMEQDPDLSRPAAFINMAGFVADEVARNILMRPLQAVSGGMSTPMQPSDPAPAAEDNETEPTGAAA